MTKKMTKIIKLLQEKDIKYVTVNSLAVNRDSIINHYNIDEEKANECLLQDIAAFGIRAFYSMRNDDYLWISIIGD